MRRAFRWQRKEFSPLIERILTVATEGRFACGSNQRHIAGGGKQFAGSSVFSHRLLERRVKLLIAYQSNQRRYWTLIFVLSKLRP